jgi:hypothetical protein
MRHTRTKSLRFTALTLALTAVQMLSGAHASEAAAVSGASDATVQVPLGPSVGSAPANLSATAASASEQTGGDISTLTQLVQQGRVTPLRSTVAGNYSATLSFFGDDLTYYVAISQQNTYWRVIATQNKKRADAVYADFVAQAERLAAAQERSAELAAQEVATQRLIEQAQIKAQQLQADAQIAQTQQEALANQASGCWAADRVQFGAPAGTSGTIAQDQKIRSTHQKRHVGDGAMSHADSPEVREEPRLIASQPRGCCTATCWPICAMHRWTRKRNSPETRDVSALCALRRIWS